MWSVVVSLPMASPPATNAPQPSFSRNVRFPIAMWERLRMLAATDRRSINWLVVDLLREGLDRRDGEATQQSPTP